LLFVAGLAGASAMILPGVSGGYLLLVLGQYIPILSAIDDLKQGLLASGGPDMALTLSAVEVCVPVGLGVIAGVIGVSNLIRWLLRRFEKTTLGLLLGLLLGAVLGLWPFQQGVPPAVGAVVKGRVMTRELIGELEPKDYPLERFSPSGAQIGMALGLLVAGFGIAQGVARVGRSES
jgi:putative membrane protein